MLTNRWLINGAVACRSALTDTKERQEKPYAQSPPAWSPMHCRKPLTLLFLLAVAAGGCGPKSEPLRRADSKSMPADAADNSNQQASPSETITESSDPATADLSGRIRLKGEIPPPRKLSITKDVETCGAVDTVVDITGSDGGVADVVIEIKGVEGEDWKFQDPEQGYVMRQKDCQFKPNLLVIPNGKDIQVYNDDPVGHNVNTGDWNKMQPPGLDPIVRPVDNKAPLKIGCNIHSWMEAWIYPVENPFFAVTDKTGNFKITGIPPGKYRVNIWHASLGRKNARLTLEAGKAATLEHEFEVK